MHFAFEWKSSTEEISQFQTVAEEQIEDEIIPITQQMVKPPPPPPAAPKLSDLLNIVEDESSIDEELEIEEKLLQNPMTLSGGQQQRVAIARAIYTHPTILLGDELTGNLDSTTSISVMKFLKKMCKKYSQTMIIVTHDERIAAMADRIIQMKDGRVV